MTAPPQGLSAGFADRYTLERELGRGGMATVYLAEDLKHHRKVAVKVLKPELAQALGSERFLREITLTAGLHHPHILPLLDSGEVRLGTVRGRDAPESSLYYTLPYVAGESLRDRLRREKQLPVEEALRISREVAEALDYAHRQGIVHRDIKPENIMLEEGHALVADFGIARAVTATGGEKLTETGIAIGTPGYMSPEQATGTQELDGRSDLYSLGCTLYEMLVGEPPYTGPTPQAILARKLSEPLPSISLIRDAVPPALEAAIAKALARVPADRYDTAAEFSRQLAVDPAVMLRQHRRSVFLRRAAVAAAGLLVVAATGLGIWSWRSRTSAPPIPLDPNLFAVMPFEAAEGVTVPITAVPQYMAAVVTGWDSVRVADVKETARQVAMMEGTNGSDGPLALQVARAQRAHRFVTGGVAQAGSRVTVTASMVSGEDGAITAQAHAEGPADSIATVAQLVLLQLLAVDEHSRIWAGGPRWGLEPHRLDHLKRRRLEAVASYVRAIRETCCPPISEEWKSRALEALRLDSTFALAAFEAYLFGENDQALAELAWAHRDELSHRDRAYVEAALSWRFRSVTVPEEMRLWEAARTLAPHDFGVARDYADRIRRYGPMGGDADWDHNFLDLYLMFAGSRPHYVGGNEKDAWQVAALAGDSTWFPRYRAAQQGINADILLARLTEPYGRWAERAARGEWTLAGLEAEDSLWRVDSLTPGEIIKIIEVATFSGRGLGDLERLVPPLERRGRYVPQAYVIALHRERGRHREWRTLRDSLSQHALLEAMNDTASYAMIRVLDFSATGEPETAATLDRIDRLYSAWLQGRDGDGLKAVPWSLCLRSLLRLARGVTTGLSVAIRDLERIAVEAGEPAPSVCGRLLELRLARATGAPLAGPARRLTDVVAEPLWEFGYPYQWILWHANLELARAWRDEGQPRRALQAVRHQQPLFNNLGYLVESLRLEAPLLGQLGDTTGALATYDHYLKLRPQRPDYEPWAATWDSVRAEYVALGGR